METMLISGGNGFLGKKIFNILKNTQKKIHVKIIVRNPKSGCHPKPIPFSNFSYEHVVGDIIDGEFVKACMEDVDTVIHLAALKDISYCEQNPIESVRTNIEGSINLLNHFHGTTFLAVSTNKAVHPESCYGATKLLMEKIIIGQSKKNPTRKYCVVRSGNILDSDGGVITIWKNQIKTRNEIELTNPAMTRFFIDSVQLSGFILQILDHGKTGMVYIPDHQLVQMDDLAKAMIERFGDPDTKIKIIGIRPGEQVHDILSLPYEKVICNNFRDGNQHRSPRKLSYYEVKQLISFLM
jgi:UDP-N-acetylglucosamine 4,6-dehydratase/5-epimerase